MVMLPDYPERAIASQQKRVEQGLLVCQMLLVSTGALWLFFSLGSQSGALFRFGPVFFLFSSALLLPDLLDFGPIQKTRTSTASCILWPPILAFSEVSRADEGISIGIILLIFVVLILFLSSVRTLSSDVKSRRWRGLSTSLGFGLALPIILANSSIESLYIIAVPALFSTIPAIFSKDGLEEERKIFASRLKKVELRILDIQSGTALMQQPNSLLKTAREEGWADPETGLNLIKKAEMEADRIESYLRDLEEIRLQVEDSISRSEKIVGRTGQSRVYLEEAMEEIENGSLRLAEEKFRKAKSRSEIIVKYWKNAMDAISKAEESIGSHDGHIVDSITATLDAAKTAIEEEDPKYALSIVSEIPSQMGNVKGLIHKAEISILEAQNAINGAEEDTTQDAHERLKEAKEANSLGNASMAIGLAEGIVRSIRRVSEAKTSVQRALRQRKIIEEKLPSGDERSKWIERIDEIEYLATTGNWIESSEMLDSLTSDIEEFTSSVGEAREMLNFLNEDWKKLRKKLDSSGKKPDDPMIIRSEKRLIESERAISEGRVDDGLRYLSEADSAMESLRRIV